jgi:metal-responsive CopG/Arc/MetJ family transcriptional regulator
MPRLTAKTETISISLPTWMIEILDEACHQKDFTRSCLIKRALKRYLLSKNDTPAMWEELYTRLMNG